MSKGEATSVMQAGFFFSILRSCRRGVIVQAVSSIFLNMLEENMPPLVKEGAMSFCSFCSEKLKEGRDIYIYQ